MTDLRNSLADQAARAAQWRFAGTLVGAAARFTIGVLLARLLPPVDFGIFALALVVTGLAQPLGDLGIASAVIQRRDLTPRHIRAAFSFSVAVGFLIAIVLVLGAPLVALLVRDVRVTPVLRLLSLGFAVQGFSVVAAGLLRRRLDFRRLFYIDTVSYVLGYGGAAVTLAVLGFGVWSLVWGSLVQTTLSSAWQIVAARHPVKPLAAGPELGELLSYGVGAGASSIANYLAVNADNFLVGRLLGATSLGLYARAFNLMNLPYVYVASVLSGVLFPAFAQIQTDIPRLRRGYLTMTRLTAVIAGPSMVALAIAAPFLVPTLYGPAWTGVVFPLQILCAAGYFRSLFHVGSIVAKSVGRVYSDLQRQVGYAIFVMIGAIAGSSFGLPGVAIGVSVAIAFMFMATGQLALDITRTSWTEYLRAQRAAIVTTTVVALFAIGARVPLEQIHARPGFITAGTLIAASLPWSVSLLWHLGEPDLAQIAGELPAELTHLVRFVRGISASTESFRG